MGWPPTPAPYGRPQLAFQRRACGQFCITTPTPFGFSVLSALQSRQFQVSHSEFVVQARRWTALHAVHKSTVAATGGEGRGGGSGSGARRVATPTPMPAASTALAPPLPCSASAAVAEPGCRSGVCAYPVSLTWSWGLWGRFKFWGKGVRWGGEVELCGLGKALRDCN